MRTYGFVYVFLFEFKIIFCRKFIIFPCSGIEAIAILRTEVIDIMIVIKQANCNFVTDLKKSGSTGR